MMMMMMMMMMIVMVMVMVMMLMMMMMMTMMYIPCRVRHDVQPGLQSLGVGYNKSPRVPGLFFLLPTGTIFFAFSSNAVFWITSNFVFTEILFMYSLKLTDGSKCTYNNRHCNDFLHVPDFCNSIFQQLVFLYLLKLLLFTLSSPRIAILIMTTSFSFLSIKTMSGFQP